MKEIKWFFSVLLLKPETYRLITLSHQLLHPSLAHSPALLDASLTFFIFKSSYNSLNITPYELITPKIIPLQKNDPIITNHALEPPSGGVNSSCCSSFVVVDRLSNFTTVVVLLIALPFFNNRLFWAWSSIVCCKALFFHNRFITRGQMFIIRSWKWEESTWL